MTLRFPITTRRKHLGLTTLCAAAFLMPFQEIRACGDFSLPRPHFEGVSEAGCVSHWEQIGSLDLGDIKVPLNIGFQTYLPYASKELGSGWILPIFDANIVQRDDSTFDMVQPDGWMGLFRRDEANPNILHGSGGMLAEINGDMITVNSTCGSAWKMIFTKGKLTNLSKGDHTLNIVRDAMGRGIAIKDGPKVVLTLEQDQETGLAKSLATGDRKYEFAYDSKPRVQTIAGVNMVGGMEQSLHKITYPIQDGGKSESFDFAVTGKMLPDLKITDTEGTTRLIVWDTINHIVADGNWNYTITDLPSPWGIYAAIGRKNQAGQSEFWHRDEAKGKEVTQSLDGTKKIKTWFNSGLLAGKTRSIEIIQNGVTKKLFSASYDEKANQIRAILEDGTVKQYQFSPQGKRQTMTQSKDGKNIETINYDDKGRVQKQTNPEGRIVEEKYDDKTNQKLTYVNGKLLYEQYVGTSRQWAERIVYDPITGEKSSTIWKEYNTQGRMVLRQITDATGKMPTMVKKYMYDSSGKITQEFNSKLGTINYAYGPEGKVIKTLIKQTLNPISTNNKS